MTKVSDFQFLRVVECTELFDQIALLLVFYFILCYYCSSMRGVDSDSDYYSSDDDEPLRNILIRSKTSLAGSMADSAVTSET